MQYRVMWQDCDGADGWKTFVDLSEALYFARNGRGWVDWVVFELPPPGRYGQCGKVVLSSDN